MDGYDVVGDVLSSLVGRLMGENAGNEVRRKLSSLRELELVLPKTYRGYDEDGKLIKQQTAYDANNYINPQEVYNALMDIKEVVSSELNPIIKALDGLTGEFNDAQFITGVTKTSDMIIELSDAVKNVKEYFALLDNSYAKAVEAHNTLQERENLNTKKSISDIPNVVRVSE